MWQFVAASCHKKPAFVNRRQRMRTCVTTQRRRTRFWIARKRIAHAESQRARGGFGTPGGQTRFGCEAKLNRKRLVTHCWGHRTESLFRHEAQRPLRETRNVGAKKAVPLHYLGPGLRGGRWPGQSVERDGWRCYRGPRLGNRSLKSTGNRGLEGAG
jgi:hypothetical protein